MNYEEKYIKYKIKYLELKNNMSGGLTNLIIHISGASGAGKTTLGNKLKNKFGNKIIVKDVDDLRMDFIKKHYGNNEWKSFDKNAYQQFIDNYVKKINKPLVFVGLNNMPWWHKNLYYNMHSKYNFYINLDDETILKQKCMRHLNELQNLSKDEVAMNDLIHDNKKFIKITTNSIKTECDASEIIKHSKKWKNDYEKQNYKIITREEIYNDVCKILNKELS
jgi:hypothetical protein